MRTSIRRYVKGSVQNNLSEYNPEKTYKVETVARKTDDQIIAEELIKAEREKKEKELLEAQLRLPPSKRSEELMRKYNLSVATDASLIDNYNTNPEQLTSYEIYYPEDAAVKDLRPSNHLVAIEKVYDTFGDEFNFYFHVSINESTPGTHNYKVDGMDTFVDKDYKLLGKGNFDLYKALYFYKMKDKSYGNEILKVFKKLGVVSRNTTDVFNAKTVVDLKIRGLGLRVTFNPLSIGETKVEEAVVEEVPAEEKTKEKSIKSRMIEYESKLTSDQKLFGYMLENEESEFEPLDGPVSGLVLNPDWVFVGKTFRPDHAQRFILNRREYGIIGIMTKGITSKEITKAIHSNNSGFYTKIDKEVVDDGTLLSYFKKMGK